MSHCNMVHKPIPVPTAMTFFEAKAALHNSELEKQFRCEIVKARCRELRCILRSKVLQRHARRQQESWTFIQDYPSGLDKQVMP